MRDSNDPRGKLFYFTAAYGILPRLFNLEYDQTLVFLHFVLQNLYNIINTRLQTILTGAERTIDFPDAFFTKLEDLFEDLIIKVAKRESFYEPLIKMANLAYVTTGNGYYLYQKGIPIIDF
jgi:hypothetical protein